MGSPFKNGGSSQIICAMEKPNLYAASQQGPVPTSPGNVKKKGEFHEYVLPFDSLCLQRNLMISLVISLVVPHVEDAYD